MHKKIGILALLLGLAAGAFALPTYDGSVKLDNTNTGVFNNTGSANTELVVGVYTDGVNLGSVEYVTYNGVYLNQAGSTFTNTSTVYWYYLSAPATGANTLTVTFLSTPTDYHIVVGAYDNVGGIGQVNTANPNPNTSMTFGGITSGSLAVYLGGANGTAPTLSQTGVTVRQSTTSGVGVETYGDTTITSSITWTGMDSVGYQLIGAQIELLPFVATATPSITATITPSITPSNTPTVTSTLTSSPTASPSMTPSITATTTPTITPSASPTSSPTTTLTTTPTASPTVTPTASPTSTISQTSTPTATPSMTQTLTRTFSSTATPTATPSSTFSPTQTSTKTVTVTITTTATPSMTPTITPSVTPTSTPTAGTIAFNSQVQMEVPFALQNRAHVTFVPNPTPQVIATCGPQQPCVGMGMLDSTNTFTYVFWWQQPGATNPQGGVQVGPGLNGGALDFVLPAMLPNDQVYEYAKGASLTPVATPSGGAPNIFRWGQHP